MKKSTILTMMLVALMGCLLLTGCGEPKLDCTDITTYRESGDKVMKYLMKKYDFEGIIRRAYSGRQTKEDEENYKKLSKVSDFLIYPHTVGEIQEVDGMPARKLVKYVNEHY